MNNNTLKEGSWVLLRLEDDSTYLIQVRGSGEFSCHKGNIAFADMIDKPYGSVIEANTGKKVFLLEPTIEDYMMKVKRHTNISYPKEAPMIMLKGNIQSGSRVLEVGTGSGALTIAFADKVGDTGKVYTYERRPEFSEMAQQNILKTGLTDRIEFFIREEPVPFGQEGVDCVSMDIPAPWEEIEWVKKALRSGGRLVCMNPTYNQIEKMASCMRENGFGVIEALEILVREILPREGRVRPVQKMVGHTEFMLYGVRLNQ